MKTTRKMRTIGSAKRITVALTTGERRRAWDCRAFGLGRVVSLILATDVELQPGTHLNLHTGELRAERTRAAA